MEIANAEHPITVGLAAFETVDELYYNQQGELPIEPLVTARSNKTGKDEPLAFAYDYGRGRVFQTLLGHNAEAIHKAGELIRRGSAWAASQPPLVQHAADEPLPANSSPLDITPSGLNDLQFFQSVLHPLRLHVYR